MSINSVQKAQATLNYLQAAKTRVEKGFALSIIVTIGAVIAAYLLHGTLFPWAFKGALATAITLGALTCILGITQRIFSSRTKKTEMELDEIQEETCKVIGKSYYSDNTSDMEYTVFSYHENLENITGRNEEFNSEEINYNNFNPYQAASHHPDGFKWYK